MAAGAAAIATASVATLLWPPRPFLIWNASASSALGLYLVGGNRDVGPGDVAAIWPPHHVRLLAAERQYLPSGIPLVKRVAAADGDRVCAVGEAIFINGRLVANRRSRDPAGRDLPAWTGCADLGQGELFVLNPASHRAFDGRYFGITRTDEVIGKARLIWPG
jgi:conjugative transfer signal peptidase TraF